MMNLNTDQTKKLAAAIAATRAAREAHEALRDSFPTGHRPEVWAEGMVDDPGRPSWATEWLREVERIGVATRVA